jgi:torulene dioxygenase
LFSGCDTGFGSPSSSDKAARGHEDHHHASGIRNLWVGTDNDFLKQLDPETLEPIGIAQQRSLHPLLKGPLSGAHAKSDPQTGDIFNYNLSLGYRATYKVFCVNAATGETALLATIMNADAAYLHSLFLTENFVILCVWGSHFALGGTKILWEKNILDVIAEFDPSKKTKWFVVDRHHGKGLVAQFESSPFFCFHTINAYEEPSKNSAEGKVDLVCDLSVYENLLSTSSGSRAYTGEEGDSTRPSLNRWRLPSVDRPTSSTSQPLHISKPTPATLSFAVSRLLSVDLPSINPDCFTKPHRFIYGVCDHGHSSFFDSLLRYDTLTHTAKVWSKHAQSPGEPIFVSDPEGREEDEGVLLSVVLDGRNGKSYLLCLDARTMDEVGRAEMQSAVGLDFMGRIFL